MNTKKARIGTRVIEHMRTAKRVFFRKLHPDISIVFVVLFSFASLFTFFKISLVRKYAKIIPSHSIIWRFVMRLNTKIQNMTRQEMMEYRYRLCQLIFIGRFSMLLSLSLASCLSTKKYCLF